MKSFRIILFAVLIFGPLFVLAENGGNAFFFNKNLKIGDSGEDVRFLQKILNKNTETQVSLFGVGSSGNESDFFGQLTKNAVIKFQELHKSDILRPFGLKSGTGFVGAATRLKLNSLLEIEAGSFSKNATNNSSSSKYSSKSSRSSLKTSKSSSLEIKKTVVVKSSSTSSTLSENDAIVRAYSTSEYQVSPGKNLILEGEGFTPTANTIHLGESRQISNLTSSEEGSKISFAIPKDLSLSKYSIWVTNANGTSKNETIKIYIVITDNPAERPAIEKVEPATATIDSEITVSGKGFTASGNNIYSGFGNIINISSSDGKTIKFNASSMLNVAKLQNDKSMKNMQAEIWFYVVNDNGYNKEPASFIIKF